MSNPPRSFHEVIEELGPLDGFDARALQPDADVSKELCDFIAALALAFNDLRNLSVAINFLMNEKAGSDVRGLSRRRGETGGIEAHIVRLYASFVSELLTLIRKNAGAVGHPFLAAVLRHIPANVGDGWNTLVEAANGRWTDSTLGKAVVIARSNLGYHYSAEEIGKGFRLTFVDGVLPATGDVPIVSRGDRPSRVRFYFADAAIQGYLSTRFPEGYVEFINQLDKLIGALHVPLFSVVTAFLQKRSAFRAVTPDETDRLA